MKMSKSLQMCLQLNCRSGFQLRLGGFDGHVTPRLGSTRPTGSRRQVAPTKTALGFDKKGLKTWYYFVALVSLPFVAVSEVRVTPMTTCRFINLRSMVDWPSPFGREHERWLQFPPFCLSFLIAFLLTQSISAQMASPGHGETQAIALHPTNPDIIYAGAAKGLCKTLNGGKDDWPAYGLETFSPRTIVVSEANPDLLYVGTHKMGVYRSKDGAVTWEAVSDGISFRDMRALVIHPRNDQVVYAGTDGGGVFKTTNGGREWKEINRGLIDKVVRTMVIDPNQPDTLYAGTWHGVYKTTDGGANWSADPNGIYDVDVWALALDPTNSKTIYAGTRPRGVYRSTDGGKTWTAGAKPLMENIASMAINPANPSHVYVGTLAGVFVSTDSGDSFETAGLRWSNNAWTLVFDPKTNPPTLYYGGVGGVLKTTNKGVQWNVTGRVRD